MVTTLLKFISLFHCLPRPASGFVCCQSEKRFGRVTICDAALWFGLPPLSSWSGHITRTDNIIDSFCFHEHVTVIHFSSLWLRELTTGKCVASDGRFFTGNLHNSGRLQRVFSGKWGDVVEWNGRKVTLLLHKLFRKSL